MIKIENLFFSYRSKLVFKNLNFFASKGEIVAFIGPSGIGKSTLFKLLAGLLSPEGGRITIEENVNPREFYQNISYMPQQDFLLPWKTVFQNIKLCAPYQKSEERKMNEEIDSLLKLLGIYSDRDSYPVTLSGGMRQRVSLARALFFNKPILLLDEPFSSLDPANKAVAIEKIKEINAKNKTTILIITHHQEEIKSLTEKLYELKDQSLRSVCG
jgi:ABC-type nitrate/sulfonate/bicarbonate transport system ATPase subunit